MKPYVSVLIGLLFVLTAAQRCSVADEAFSGKESQWNGFTRFDFEINGRPVLVVTPKAAASGKPWVWPQTCAGYRTAE